jgi:hypothetical protein
MNYEERVIVTIHFAVWEEKGICTYTIGMGYDTFIHCQPRLYSLKRMI